ncbi:nucleotidyltransferase family protein [Streptomyces europaeiscabiei]|uniref:Nucleotidyltransferase family protein n=3 Tax=Streptomyces europaeiscabiei TaxID=146819 RepID=A0ABU4NJF9_9ACTN|nr:nucleotidyltransferase family protein [Streptomyces europaeiscabiei]MDX2530179.1 nucleotidyltransferase family protein [Streptomyces europaeiscabiei]MDX2770574.1 nucleotidyltransferase family protein [Streptomyces europaeiscabiei]MDX3544665.1 nucleotidyltransferase family protein [Streptomyces europaeiscabiei]MDX3554015.1 nucleotidyltransferase family protein [Streptomyces europaeiscabiei]MDX3671020.1 nucleotidyltransferase family protein [Streptomyces europaeiscabiei]
MTDPNAASRPVQAVILAGGQGSRLRPYTDDRPKPMVEIPGTGTPIIGHQLTWLAEEGVTDVVVSCGHLADVLQKWLDSADLPVRVTTVVETEPLGRGGGLKYAASHLPHPDRPWYATNGDIWTRFSLRDMADFHAERDALATLALARPRIPWGAVKTDGFGRVTDFIEAPPTTYEINAGVYVFSPEFTDLLPARGDHERTTFPRLARERRLAGFPIPQGAYWRAIDTAKDLTEAAKELAALSR